MQENGSIISTLILPMLPLFIYIGVEFFFGTIAGLISALVLGFLELSFTFIKSKKFDKFIVLDISLLSFLGAVSILLENEIFFLMKPAIFELIFAIVLAISVFSGKNILLMMMKRYIKKDNPLMEKQIHIMSKALLYIFVIHSIMIVISALFFSKGVWAFVSTTLLYIMMGIFFVATIIKKRYFTEILPLMDKEGNIIGKAPRDYCHAIKYPYHPVVHLMVTDSKGRYLLQKRDPRKTFPNFWDVSVGGHISFGEDMETSLKREAKEEINLKNFEYHFLGKIVTELEIAPEIIYFFHAEVDDVKNVKNKEVAEIKYFELNEIASLNPITEHLYDEIELVEEFLNKKKKIRR